MRPSSPTPIPFPRSPHSQSPSYDLRPLHTAPNAALSDPPKPLTFRRMPRAPEESARSLPARSTKLILLTWVRGKRQEVTGSVRGRHIKGTPSKGTRQLARDGESQEWGTEGGYIR